MKHFSTIVLTFILIGLNASTVYASFIREEESEPRSLSLSSPTPAKDRLFDSSTLLRRSLAPSGYHSEDEGLLKEKKRLIKGVCKITPLKKIKKEEHSDLLKNLEEERTNREKQEKKREIEKTRRISLEEKEREARHDLNLQKLENDKLIQRLEEKDKEARNDLNLQKLENDKLTRLLEEKDNLMLQKEQFFKQAQVNADEHIKLKNEVVAALDQEKRNHAATFSQLNQKEESYRQLEIDLTALKIKIEELEKESLRFQKKSQEYEGYEKYSITMHYHTTAVNNSHIGANPWFLKPEQVHGLTRQSGVDFTVKKIQ